MKPIVFFDFDGVLCFDKYWRSLPNEQYLQVQELMFGNDKTRIKDWMIGRYTAEEINQYIAAETGIPYETLWRVFVYDCKNMEVSKSILERISELRERYITILITGNMDSFTRFTVPALKLYLYFDHINNSYFAEKQKLDEGGILFSQYAQKLDVPLKKCTLMDDSAKNCEVFRSLGGTAYQITSEKTVSEYLGQLD